MTRSELRRRNPDRRELGLGLQSVWLHRRRLGRRPDAGAAQHPAIDVQIDDGKTSTGSARQTQTGRYTAIVE